MDERDDGEDGGQGVSENVDIGRAEIVVLVPRFRCVVVMVIMMTMTMFVMMMMATRQQQRTDDVDT